MESDRSTQDKILEQIVARLIAKVRPYSESNCFLSDQITPVSWPSGDICCTVSLGSGRYPEGLYAGGGHATICKATTVRVSPFIRSLLDKPPHLKTAIIGADKGLVSKFEPMILRALLCEERDGRTDAWMPCNPDGMGMLRSEIAPAATSQIMPASDMSGFLGFTIDFAIEFDWAL